MIIKFIKKFRKGFTLIELLVVIAIIGILASLITGNFFTSLKKARDAKRQGDLKAFQNAIEQCYSVNNFTYPTISGTGTGSITETCPATGGPSMTITDPLGTGTYIYTVTSTTTSYSITVGLETSSVNFTVSNQQ